MRSSLFLTFALLIALPTLVRGQSETGLLPPPRLLLPQENGKQGTLALSEADITVNIAGPLAQTTFVLTFKNDTNRVLQGDLDFPLPEGATISGYGLDVNGKMVDGVPVEREKARVAFEKEVRKGADPGLVEKTVGNNFRTRVYPIPANGTRTIKVEYVSDMTASGTDLLYRVPLRWNQKLPLAKIHIIADQTGEFPRLSFGASTRLLTFVKQGERFTASKTFESFNFDSDLEIRLPNANLSPLSIAEPFTRTTLGEPENYFVGSDVLPAPLQSASRPTTVRRIGLIWDASLSRRTGNLSRERQILRDLFRAIKNVTVDLTVLRDIVEPRRTFAVRGGDASALLRYLETIPYDGGTQLGAVPCPTNTPDGGRYDYHLLFTDGIGNLGKAVPFPSVVPVYTINSNPVANHDLLRHIAQRSGGVYLNLDRMSDVQAVGLVGTSPFSLLSVTVEQGKVADIFPNGPRPALGRVFVTGRLLSDGATLRLNFGRNGRITYTRTLRIPRASNTGSGLAGKFWAQRKADDLSLLPEQNAEWLLSLGKDFNIVTANTSLMVLERLDQYIEHGIVPPKSSPDLYAGYLSSVRNKENNRRQNETSKRQSVLAMWQERVKWWNRKYPSFAGKVKSKPVQRPRIADSTTLRLSVANAHPPTVVRSIAANGVAPTPPPQVLRQLNTYQANVNGGGGGGFPGAAAGGRGNARSAPIPQPRPSAAHPSLYASTESEGVSNRSDRLSESKAKAEEADSNATGATIQIKAWSPDTPYLKVMKSNPANAYSAYLRYRDQYGTAPAFYLDCAEYLLQRGQTTLGLRVLTNILELKLDSAPLTRIVAHRLAQLGQRDLAIGLFEQVTKMRPEEPQSWRDLALVLADHADSLASNNPRQALLDYNRSLELLNKVILGRWDRFEEIEAIAVIEANRILVHAKRLPAVPGLALKPSLDTRLIQNLTCDLRIVMTWDSDSTDMDLWVDEPTGERCMYNYNRTQIGGYLSRDFTEGYGPEEYLLHRAPRGAYKIRTNYYGDRAQQLTGGTTVQATVYTNFGRPNEKKQTLTLRLTKSKETIDIGAATIQ